MSNGKSLTFKIMILVLCTVVFCLGVYVMSKTFLKQDDFKEKLGKYGKTTVEISTTDVSMGQIPVLKFSIQSDGKVQATNLLGSKEMKVKGLDERPVYVVRTSSCLQNNFDIVVLTEKGNVYLSNIKFLTDDTEELVFTKVKSDFKVVGIDTMRYPGFFTCYFENILAYDENGVAYVVSNVNYDIYMTYEQYRKQVEEASDKILSEMN